MSKHRGGYFSDSFGSGSSWSNDGWSWGKSWPSPLELAEDHPSFGLLDQDERDLLRKFRRQWLDDNNLWQSDVEEPSKWSKKDPAKIKVNRENLKAAMHQHVELLIKTREQRKMTLTPREFARRAKSVEQTASLIAPHKRIKSVANQMWAADLKEDAVHWTPIIPWPPYNRLLTPAEVLFLTVHEAKHVDITGEYSVPKDLEKRSQAFHSLVNCVEDMRIERKLCDEFPGFQELREQFGPEMLKVHTELGVSETYDLDYQIGLNWHAMEHGVEDRFGTEEAQKIAEQSWKWVSGLADKAKSTAEIANALYLFVKKLEELRGKSILPENQPEPDANDLQSLLEMLEEMSGDGQEGDCRGKSKGFFKGKWSYGKASDPGYSSMEALEALKEQINQASLRSPSQKLQDAQKRIAELELLLAQAQAQAEGASDLFDAQQQLGELLEQLNANAQELLDKAKAAGGKMAGKKGGQNDNYSEWNECALRVKPEIRKISRRLKMILEHNRAATWNENKASGRLNSSKAHRVRTGQFRIFRKPQEVDDSNYLFVLCVDVSGSMQQNALPLTDATVMLMESLEANGIETAVIPYNGEVQLSTKLRQHPLFIKKNDLAGTLLYPNGGTQEAVALSLAADQLETFEGRRVLITITDGYTNQPEVCASILNSLESQGVITIGVGINTNRDALAHYREAIVIRNGTELPELFMEMLRRLIRKRR